MAEIGWWGRLSGAHGAQRRPRRRPAEVHRHSHAAPRSPFHAHRIGRICARAGPRPASACLLRLQYCRTTLCPPPSPPTMAQPPAPLPQGSAGEEAGAAAEGAASGLPGLGESGGDGPANAADVAVDVEEKQGHSAATEGSTSGTQSGSQAPDEAPGRVEGEEGGAPRSGPKAAAVTRSARDADSARNQKKADSSEAGAQKKNRKAVQRRPSKRSLREARVALAAQVSFPGVGGVVGACCGAGHPSAAGKAALTPRGARGRAGGEAPTPTPLLGTEPGPRVAVDGSGPERAADRAEKVRGCEPCLGQR